MMTLEQDLADAIKRWRADVRELERSARRLSANSERLMAQTHAHVKSAAASELSRILVRHGVKVVGA